VGNRLLRQSQFLEARTFRRDRTSDRAGAAQGFVKKANKWMIRCQNKTLEIWRNMKTKTIGLGLLL
jgi:hypothetical protein